MAEDWVQAGKMRFSVLEIIYERTEGVRNRSKWFSFDLSAAVVSVWLPKLSLLLLYYDSIILHYYLKVTTV